jgi:predicted outer membrane repeat protein
VKGGTHYVHRGCPTDTIRLRPELSVRGGFAGSESSEAERVLGANETTLDGRDGPDGERHVYHVVTGAEGVELDGFTIQYGRAEHPSDERHQRGGGLDAHETPMHVRDARFLHNRAIQGGAAWGYDVSLRELRFTRTEFSHNAAMEGGAISGNLAVNVHVDECVFEDNVASDGGGAIAMSNAPLTLTGSALRGNFAFDGGGLLSRFGRTTISESLFEDNLAVSQGGGAMLRDASSEVRASSFVGNFAGWGGGGLNVTSGHETMLDELEMRDNEAGHNGGGLRLVESNTRLSRSHFTRNHAGSMGGGINVWGQGSVLESYADRVEGNTCSLLGGGIHLHLRVTLRMTNGVLLANRAARGAALSASSGGSLELLHCTIAGNVTSPDGAAVDTESDIRIVNGILHDLASGSELAHEPDVTPVVHHSAIRGCFEGEGNIDVDCDFVDLDGGDLRLAAGSPCIDAGDPIESTPIDFVGYPRQGAPDLGAHEYQGGVR